MSEGDTADSVRATSMGVIGSEGMLCASRGPGTRVRYVAGSSWVCIRGPGLSCSTRKGWKLGRDDRDSDTEDAPKVANVGFKGRRGWGKGVVCLCLRG